MTARVSMVVFSSHMKLRRHTANPLYSSFHLFFLQVLKRNMICNAVCAIGTKVSGFEESRARTSEGFA